MDSHAGRGEDSHSFDLQGSRGSLPPAFPGFDGGTPCPRRCLPPRQPVSPERTTWDRDQSASCPNKCVANLSSSLRLSQRLGDSHAPQRPDQYF
jgi:hypothetical protein